MLPLWFSAAQRWLGSVYDRVRACTSSRRRLQVLQQSGLPTSVPLQQAAPVEGADGDAVVDPAAGGSPDADEDQPSVSEQSVSRSLTPCPDHTSLRLTRPGPSQSIARVQALHPYIDCHVVIAKSFLCNDIEPRTLHELRRCMSLAGLALSPSLLGRIAQASVPIGYVTAFLSPDSHSSPFPVPVPAARSAAVQLLISYMGATLGSLAAVRAFVQQAVDGYRCALH